MFPATVHRPRTDRSAHRAFSSPRQEKGTSTSCWRAWVGNLYSYSKNSHSIQLYRTQPTLVIVPCIQLSQFKHCTYTSMLPVCTDNSYNNDTVTQCTTKMCAAVHLSVQGGVFAITVNQYIGAVMCRSAVYGYVVIRSRLNRWKLTRLASQLDVDGCTVAFTCLQTLSGYSVQSACCCLWCGTVAGFLS